MTDYSEMKCPKCGQQLRVPGHIGGMLMACPTCGEKFHSDFKLGGVGSGRQRHLLTTIFEMPSDIVRRLCQYLANK